MARRTGRGKRAATTDDMRQPIQSRAQVTIDRICDASVEILTEGGWDAFNTNAVAARAGVAGPTVYRYFPNKYVLAAELRRRVDETEARSALPAIAAIGESEPLRRSVHTWVLATAEARREQPAALLLRSVSAAVPDLSEPPAERDDILVALIAALGRLNPSLTPAETADRARAIRTSVDSLIDDAIRGGRPTTQQLQLIVDMATTMFEAASSARMNSLTVTTD